MTTLASTAPVGSAALPEPPSLPLTPALQRSWQDAERCLQEGDLAGARHLYQSLIDLPQLSGACFRELARIARRQGDIDRARILLHAALRLESRDWAAYALLSDLLAEAQQREQRRALWMTWGIALAQAQEHKAAVERFAAVVAEEPRQYAAWLNLGQERAALQKDHPESHRSFWQATRLAARAYPEVASLLQDIEVLLEKVLDPPPALPPGAPLGVEQVERALTSLGYVCNQYHLHTQAIACHRLALRYAPGLALAHWNLGLSLLMEEATWQAGWEAYEWRWHWPECPERPRHLPVPLWRGEDLHGKRLMVWTEQGFGDAIQFVALLPRVQALGAELVLETTAPLRRLFAENFPEIPIVARPDHPDQMNTEGAVDYVVPLMSLPQRLHLHPKDRPLATGYLHPVPKDRVFWQQRLPADAATPPRVGLVWAGKSHNWGFEQAQVLLRTPGIHWVSLQLGPEQQRLADADLPDVIDLSGDLKDFAETAAILTCLDLIITIDSAVAHLAGALQRPVWVLTHSKPNWRWPGTGSDCPWYPTVRLFRRPIDSDWSALLPPLQKALSRWRKDFVRRDPAGGINRQR